MEHNWEEEEEEIEKEEEGEEEEEEEEAAEAVKVGGRQGEEEWKESDGRIHVNGKHAGNSS